MQTQTMTDAPRRRDVLRHLESEGDDDAVGTLEAILETFRGLEQDEPEHPRFGPLVDAGRVGIDAARVEGDPWHGQRWEAEGESWTGSGAELLTDVLEARA